MVRHFSFQRGKETVQFAWCALGNQQYPAIGQIPHKPRYRKTSRHAPCGVAEPHSLDSTSVVNFTSLHLSCHCKIPTFNPKFASQAQGQTNRSCPETADNGGTTFRGGLADCLQRVAGAHVPFHQSHCARAASREKPRRRGVLGLLSVSIAPGNRVDYQAATRSATRQPLGCKVLLTRGAGFPTFARLCDTSASSFVSY